MDLPKMTPLTKSSIRGVYTMYILLFRLYIFLHQFYSKLWPLMGNICYHFMQLILLLYATIVANQAKSNPNMHVITLNKSKKIYYSDFWIHMILVHI